MKPIILYLLIVIICTLLLCIKDIITYLKSALAKLTCELRGHGDVYEMFVFYDFDSLQAHPLHIGYWCSRCDAQGVYDDIKKREPKNIIYAPPDCEGCELCLPVVKSLQIPSVTTEQKQGLKLLEPYATEEKEAL